MAWFAPCYDLLTAPGEAWLGVHRRALVSDLAGVVVEIGAGTGANLAHYGPAATLWLCEPDADMRSRLERRAAGRPDTTVRSASAEALPFPDASVDAVVSTLVLCSVADLERSVAEVFRVLRPGGTFRFLEHVASPGWRGVAQRALDPAWRRCAGGCRLHRDPSPVIARYGAVDLHHEWPIGLPPFLQPILVGRATAGRPPE